MPGRHIDNLCSAKGTPNPMHAVIRRALFLVVLAGHWYPAQAATPIIGQAKVRDGDSIDIGAQRIRLWGIDAPEYKQTCRRREKAWDCGAEAAQALRRHLAGRTVKCLPVETDRHGRTVSRCSAGGRSINEWLVREGWAVDYTRYSKGAFAQAQAQARAGRRGIWSGSFDPPEHYRRRSR